MCLFQHLDRAEVIQKYDTNKDRRLSSAEFSADQDMGEHFGWIDADDDEAAVEAAKTMMDGHRYELWAHSRLVMRLDRGKR